MTTKEVQLTFAHDAGEDTLQGEAQDHDPKHDVAVEMGRDSTGDDLVPLPGRFVRI